jgi:hypothetical protein
MGEREDHFDLGSGWPLAKDEPRSKRGMRSSPWFRVAILILVALPLVAIAIGVRVSTGPPVFAPEESPGPYKIHDWSGLRPNDELRKIAIAEVKKREGWSGKAIGPTPGEGSTLSFLIERDPDKPTGHAVQVDLEGYTGHILDYRVAR